MCRISGIPKGKVPSWISSFCHLTTDVMMAGNRGIINYLNRLTGLMNLSEWMPYYTERVDFIETNKLIAPFLRDSQYEFIIYNSRRNPV